MNSGRGGGRRATRGLKSTNYKKSSFSQDGYLSPKAENSDCSSPSPIEISDNDRTLGSPKKLISNPIPSLAV